MVSRLFDRYTKGAPSAGIDADAILGARMVDSREDGLPTITNDDDQYDAEIHITNDGVYRMAVEVIRATPNTVNWGNYTRTGYLGAFSDSTEPTPTADDQNYYNTTVRFWYVSYRPDPLVSEYRWLHESAPQGWLGHFESREEAAHHVTALNQIAFTGSLVQRVSSYAPGSAAETFRNWELIDISPRSVFDALKTAVDGLVPLPELEVLIGLLEDLSKANTDLQNLNITTDTQRENVRTAIGAAATTDIVAPTAESTRDLLQTLTGTDRLGTKYLYRRPFSAISVDLSTDEDHPNSFLEVSGGADITLVDAAMSAGDKLEVYNSSSGSINIIATSGDIQGIGDTFSLNAREGVTLVKREGTNEYAITGTSQVNVGVLTEVALTGAIDLTNETIYNTYVNKKAVLSLSRFVTVSLPGIHGTREDFVNEDDFFEFEFRVPAGLASISLVLDDTTNEDFSNTTATTYVLARGATATLNPPNNLAVRITVQSAGNSVWLTEPIVTAEALQEQQEGQPAQIAIFELNSDDEAVSAYVQKSLQLAGTVYFSERAGDDNNNGQSLDKPVRSLARLAAASADVTFEAKGLHMALDDSFYHNNSYDGIENFDLHAPTVSFSGLRPYASTHINAHTIVASQQQIVMQPDVSIRLKRIENGTTGAQIQFPSGDIGTVNLEIDSADMASVPITFASGTKSGNIHVRIEESNLTADPFNDVRSSYNINGYIRLSNGEEIHYGGGQGFDTYVRSIDANLTADFKRPAMLIRNEGDSRTLTLPASSDSPKERSVYKFLVANHSFTSTSHNLNVTISGTEDFQNGGNDFVLSPNGQAIIELWNVPEGAFWRYHITETRYQARFIDGDSGDDLPPLRGDINLQLDSNVGLPANLFSINTDGDIVVGAKCRLKVENVGATARWHTASEFHHGSDAFRTGSKTSGIAEDGTELAENVKDVDQIFTFDTPFTIGTDDDVFVVVTPTQLNRVEVLPVVDTTLAGFTINRDSAIQGNVGFNYQAINRAALASGGENGMFFGAFHVEKGGTEEIEFRMNPQPRIQNMACRAFSLTEGNSWIDCDPGDVISVRQSFTIGVAVGDFQMNVEAILR